MPQSSILISVPIPWENEGWQLTATLAWTCQKCPAKSAIHLQNLPLPADCRLWYKSGKKAERCEGLFILHLSKDSSMSLAACQITFCQLMVQLKDFLFASWFPASPVPDFPAPCAWCSSRGRQPTLLFNFKIHLYHHLLWLLQISCFIMTCLQTVVPAWPCFDWQIKCFRSPLVASIKERGQIQARERQNQESGKDSYIPSVLLPSSSYSSAVK